VYVKSFVKPVNKSVMTPPIIKQQLFIQKKLLDDSCRLWMIMSLFTGRINRFRELSIQWAMPSVCIVIQWTNFSALDKGYSAQVICQELWSR